MDSEGRKICEEAKEFARKHKKSIARELTSVELFAPDEFPVSVFMAGSPGAGKTESSRNLIQTLTKDNGRVLRIDPDDLRARFPGYTGANSHLFMAATSIVADKIHDIALSQGQSFVFDGTLSNISRARENISRSLDRKRFVQIFYVYQDPFQAWEFVKSREIKDGRNIPKDAFVDQYFTARRNVNTLKVEFGDRIKVDLVVKNIDGTDFSYRENIGMIDSHVPEKYTEDYLRAMIN